MIRIESADEIFIGLPSAGVLTRVETRPDVETIVRALDHAMLEVLLTLDEVPKGRHDPRGASHNLMGLNSGLIEFGGLVGPCKRWRDR